MSAERAIGQDQKRENWKKRAKGAAKIAAVGLGTGLTGVAGITMRDHRQLTHRSIELHPTLEKAADLEQQSIGVSNPNVWASVHRVHHEMTDTSLYPFFRLSHAIKQAEAQGVEVPEKFGQLDPFVPEFSREQVVKIGTLAEEVLQKRLGTTYEPQGDYSSEQLQDVLHPREPQYTYPEYVAKTKPEEYSQDDIARILLTDPHSPALMNRDNGVQGVAISNINLYREAANLFRARPDLKPEDLHNPDDDNPKSVKKAVIGGFVIPAAAVLLYRGKYAPKDFAIAAVAGAAINGIKIGTEIFGGNVTNSAGHMGDPVESEVLSALTEKKYHIKLKADGTISTNTVGKGIPGKLMSWATFDEVGGQEEHHEDPSKIAYTNKTGREAWAEAPWGKLLETLAYSERFPLIQPGKGFEGSRPDEPHEAVLLIQQARAEQYAIEQANRDALGQNEEAERTSITQKVRKLLFTRNKS